MNFGKNTQLVEEVMSFIRNNKVFFRYSRKQINSL